jgi:autotransporter-associated beta strand protein
MVFRRDNSPGGSSTITLEIPDLYAGVVALPWALWADPATGKVTDFAYVVSGSSPTDKLFVKDAGGSGLFLQENGADYWNTTDNLNFKHYIAETSELLPGEGSGFFGIYDPSAVKNLGDVNAIGNILFNIDNNNTSGTQYVGNGGSRAEANNELQIATGQTFVLKSNLTTGFLGGAILIANTVGDTNKKITGGAGSALSSELVTNYFDPNVANLLVKTYDLLIHNYAEPANLVTPASGGGIFTLDINVVNNPSDSLAPLNLVHNGTGWTKMARATSAGAGYSYTGKTFFNGGTVWVEDVNKLGAATGGTVSDRYYFTGGRLKVGDFTNPTGTSLGSLTLDSKRGITIGGDGAFIDVSNALTTLNYAGLISVEVHAPTFAAGITRTSNIGLGDLFKEGAGKLVLTNAAHTYSGLTKVTAGILEIDINSAASVTNQNSGYLGSNYSFIDGTFIAAGGRLDLQITGGATNGTSEWMTLDGGTLGTTASHTDGTLDGVIRVRQNSTVDVVGTGTLRFNSTAGYLSSSGSTGTPTLTKAGTGTLLLFENNTDYAGNWAVNQGRVVGATQGLAYGVGTSMSLGDGSGSGVAEALLTSRTTPTVAVTGSTNGTTTVTVASTAGLYVGMPVSGGTIPGGAVITSIPNGTTFTISGAVAPAGSSTYTATLNFINTMDYHVVNNITVSSGAQVKRIGATNHSVIANSGQQNDRYNYDGTVTLNGNLLASYQDAVANTGILASGRDQYIALNGSLSGAGSLTTEIVYTGNTAGNENDLRITTELNGDNTAWTGSVSTGNASNDADLQHLVRLGNNNALKSDNGVTMGFNSTLQVGGKDVTMGNLLITPTGSATTNQVTVENASNTAGKLTITQTTNEDWDVLFRNGTTPAVYSAIAPTAHDNTLSIAKAGSATAVMTQSNTYTGSTTMMGGILRVSSLINGGLASNIGASTNAAANLVFDGGTLEYTGAATSTDRNYTLTTNGGSLAASGTGTLTVSGNMTASGSSGAQTFTLTGTNIAANTISGTISNGTGTNVTSLSKTGAGTWALTNANTYSGTTTISVGTLLANNSTGSATGTSIVSVTSGGTLGGTGIVGGNTTINLGGTLLIGNLAGDVGPQDLQFNGTLNSSGTLAFDLWTYTAGGNGTADVLRFGSDSLITLTGTLQVTNSTATTATSFINGSAWQIIDWANVTTPANRNVNFTTLSLPTLSGGLTWNTSALNTTGFISVAIVPEPGRAMLLFMAMLWMIGARRRRQA